MTNNHSICYLDCNASTPVEPEVIKVMLQYLEHDFGNPSSRTHEYGRMANQAVQNARKQVSSVVGADKDEVILQAVLLRVTTWSFSGLLRLLKSKIKNTL